MTPFFRRLACLFCLASVVLPACSTGSGGTGGESCSTIAGEYAFDETFTSACAHKTPITNAVTVKVTGTTDVAITNHTNYLVSCKLAGCTCTTGSGQVYTFDAAGFSTTETDSGCTITSTGTRR